LKEILCQVRRIILFQSIILSIILGYWKSFTTAEKIIETIDPLFFFCRIADYR
jgi:hypothetical protein